MKDYLYIYTSAGVTLVFRNIHALNTFIKAQEKIGNTLYHIDIKDADTTQPTGLPATQHQIPGRQADGK